MTAQVVPVRPCHPGKTCRLMIQWPPTASFAIKTPALPTTRTATMRITWTGGGNPSNRCRGWIMKKLSIQKWNLAFTSRILSPLAELDHAFFCPKFRGIEPMKNWCFVKFMLIFTTRHVEYDDMDMEVPATAPGLICWQRKRWPIWGKKFGWRPPGSIAHGQ